MRTCGNTYLGPKHNKKNETHNVHSYKSMLQYISPSDIHKFVLKRIWVLGLGIYDF